MRVTWIVEIQRHIWLSVIGPSAFRPLHWPFRLSTPIRFQSTRSRRALQRVVDCLENTFYVHQGGYVIVVVCLSVCFSVCLLATLRKNFQTNLHGISREGCQWASEQMITFWWRSGSQSGYRNYFPDSSLLGDTESGVNRLPCVTLQCMACTSRHRHSNYDVITLPAYGTDIATLVRRASAEVCTLPVLLVKSVWTLSIGKKTHASRESLFVMCVSDEQLIRLLVELGRRRQADEITRDSFALYRRTFMYSQSQYGLRKHAKLGTVYRSGGVTANTEKIAERRRWPIHSMNYFYPSLPNHNCHTICTRTPTLPLEVIARYRARYRPIH